jgi:hypothetical protein
MNPYDRDNLNFLLTASRDVLKDWYSQIDSDDLVYASELLDQYAEELNLRNSMINADQALDTLCDLTNDPYAEANDLLARFTLKS